MDSMANFSINPSGGKRLGGKGKPKRAALTLVLLLSAIRCVPVTTPPDSDFTVSAETESAALFEGMTATLTSTTSGGQSPVNVRWDQNDGPADVSLTGVTTNTLTAGPFQTTGRYVFRVLATDGSGQSAKDFVTVNVNAIVDVSAARLALVDAPVALDADVADPSISLIVLWEITSGIGEIDNADTRRATLRIDEPGTVRVRFSASITGGSEQSGMVTRELDVVAVSTLMPRVLIETNQGDITLELDGENAPLHVANMLQYVDEGFYDGLLFHRNACTMDEASGECDPFVLQGGGFFRNDEDELELREPTQLSVTSEADNGLTNNVPLTVSLALTAMDANSGTSQFFINLRDNGFLDDQGFTVFGRVVAGEEVVNAIVASERVESPILGGEVSLPVDDVVIERMIRVEGDAP